MKSRILKRLTVLLVVIILLALMAILSLIDGSNYLMEENGKYIPILILGFVGLLGPLLLIDYLLWRLIRNKFIVNLIGSLVTLILLFWFIA
jgi:hypothetical protein